MKTKDELAAATLLDVINVLKQGQAIQQETQKTNISIRETLVQILAGQNEISEQIRMGVSRANEHELDIARGKTAIDLLKSRTNDHAARIKRLEETDPNRPRRAAG